MTADHNSNDPAKRNNGSGIPKAGRFSTDAPHPEDEATVTLSEEEVEQMIHGIGQAYVAMESAGRYVEEQDHAPASIALAAALDSARQALAAMLVRLLAGWAGVAAVLADCI